MTDAAKVRLLRRELKRLLRAAKELSRNGKSQAIILKVEMIGAEMALERTK